MFYQPLNLKNPTKKSIAIALSKLTKKNFGKVPKTALDSAKISRAMEIGMSEIYRQLIEENTGEDWYDGDIETMEKHLKKMFPELRRKEMMDLFKAITAITSNGTKVSENLGNAVAIYRASEAATKPFPGRRESGLGWARDRSRIVEGQLNKLTGMVQDLGVKGVVKFLNTKHPVEVFKQRTINGDVLRKVRAAGEAFGSYIFGPKIGAFYQNLNGINDELTADTWFARSWNRWMGTGIDENGDVVETPADNHEREVMHKALSEMSRLFQERHGLELSVADLQAVLWYYEQQLWQHHGQKGVASTSYGYAAEVQRELWEADKRNPKRSRESLDIRGKDADTGAVSRRDGNNAPAARAEGQQEEVTALFPPRVNHIHRLHHFSHLLLQHRLPIPAFHL